MALPQSGIFALGNPAHSYLELDLADARPSTLSSLVTAAARLGSVATTMGGVNVVVGFRPEVLAEVMASAVPTGLSGFTTPVIGEDGFTMPATQHDVVVWLAGGAVDILFDAATAAVRAMRPHGILVEETSAWSYRRDLDLTGFTDGTENPELSIAPQLVLIPSGQPGAGGSVLLLQRWPHDGEAWNSLSDAEQEQVIGRTKDTDEELEDRPEASHVARTDQEDFGDILRRNTAYGTVREHGTMFVGFAATRTPLDAMLASMAGADGHPRDDLTRFARPETGAYYVVPPVEVLTALAPPDQD